MNFIRKHITIKNIELKKEGFNKYNKQWKLYLIETSEGENIKIFNRAMIAGMEAGKSFDVDIIETEKYGKEIKKVYLPSEAPKNPVEGNLEPLNAKLDEINKKLDLLVSKTSNINW